MTSIFDEFFGRIPERVLASISNGCTLGDKAFRQVMESDPELLGSPYMYGLRSRIHDKAVQMYLHDRVAATGLAQVYSKNTGFGNRVATIFGDDFSIMPCHVSERGTLPPVAKYKVKACENNPGKDYGQQNLFTPPYAEKYSNINFFVTVFFDGMVAEPTIVLPDKTFTTILRSWSLPTVVAAETSETERSYQERVMPRLLSEVKHEREVHGNG